MPLSAYFKGKKPVAKMKGDDDSKAKPSFGKNAAPDDDKPKRKSLGQRIGERMDG